MGDGLLISSGVFCGHAVESSFITGSATALCSGGGAWPPFGCTALPPVGYQSKDWFQVVGSFSSARRCRTPGPLAASPPLSRAHCQSLAQRDRPGAKAPSALGSKEDLCSPAQKASAHPPAQGANHHQVVGASGMGECAAVGCSSGTAVAPSAFDRPAKAQPSVDRGFQRLVLHSRRAARGPADGPGPVQPLPVGHPIAAPSSRAGAPIFPGPVRQVWATGNHPRRPRPALCWRRRAGFVATLGLVAASGNPGGVYGSGSTPRQCGS